MDVLLSQKDEPLLLSSIRVATGGSGSADSGPCSGNLGIGSRVRRQQSRGVS